MKSLNEIGSNMSATFNFIESLRNILTISVSCRRAASPTPVNLKHADSYVGSSILNLWAEKWCSHFPNIKRIKFKGFERIRF